MIDLLLRSLSRLLLALRYRVRLVGLDRVTQSGTEGILFLANHPALIDPVILMTYLNRDFRPRALADRDQIGRPVIKQLARHLGIIPLPDVKIYGSQVTNEVNAAVDGVRQHLATGGNMLLYPSGHIYRTRFEDLRGNSGAYDLVSSLPNVRVVLVRSRGIWGSALSLAYGEFPRLGPLVMRAAGNLLRNFLFWVPKRPVTVEFFEPRDLPRDQGKEVFNRYLEAYYNQDAPPALKVAEHFADKPRMSTQDDPAWSAVNESVDVPDSTRERVEAQLREMTGIPKFSDGQLLAEDLGLDSLARADLLLWLAQEFGQAPQEGDALRSVGDVLLAATGQAISLRPTALDPPPRKWFNNGAARRLEAPAGANLAEWLLASAAREPGRVILADQLRGGLTYRQLILGILALRPHIERLDGKRVGIMLPASVGATVTYWATVFAGKEPVQLNWTTGARNLEHLLELTEVKHVLTAKALLARLEGQGVDLGSVKDKLLLLEEVRERITRGQKLGALFNSFFNWSSLRSAKIAPTATVLMTSGSESLPKAVPLSHKNLMTNIRDVLELAHFSNADRMFGFLPPFHSLGLTVTAVMPPAVGLPCVYHANPTAARTLSQMIELYRVTLLLGTPTFLNGILRATKDARMLRSLRLIVTGAEKCPDHVYRALEAIAPEARVLEGYGITECSPVVAVNRPERPVPGTIGPVVPSVEHVIVHPETEARVAQGQTGLLLVRGESIFDGYIGNDAASPFIEHDGKQWYRTGDLVSADEAGVLTFRGRLKRFVKVGGEMISLPAIEAALMSALVPDEGSDEGPCVAVVALGGDEGRPEIIAITSLSFDRAAANDAIRASGLSALHSVGRVERIAEIPVLGTGKVDYRNVQQLVEQATPA